MKLLSTQEVSEAVGLSAFELVRGYKEGLYPAIVIGKGGRGSKLRWDLDMLTAAIEKAMNANMNEQARLSTDYRRI